MRNVNNIANCSTVLRGKSFLIYIYFSYFSMSCLCTAKETQYHRHGAVCAILLWGRNVEGLVLLEKDEEFSLLLLHCLVLSFMSRGVECFPNWILFVVF
jgi:hypothetical protein